MTNDGVFLNPDSGDIIATGLISAAQISFPTANDLLVNGLPFVKVISSSVSTTLSDYYTKIETSSSNEISSAIGIVDAVIATEVAARSDADDVIISKVDTLSISLSDYYTKSETSSANEISTKFNTLSTYSLTLNLLSNDGYALNNDLNSLTKCDSVANAYDNTKTYQVDEVVMYNLLMYRCISASIAGTLPTLTDYWEQTNATNSDTAFLLDDQGHLVVKDVGTSNTEYVDAYRFNATSVLMDAAFNDIGILSNNMALALPPAIDGHARDFVAIFSLSGDTLPSFTFPLVSSDLEPWSEAIPEWTLSTTYRITFTETRPDKWEIHTLMYPKITPSIVELNTKVNTLSGKVDQLELIVGLANANLEDALG